MNLYPILLIILIILLILSAILIATSSFLLSYNDKKINSNLVKGGNIQEVITKENKWGLYSSKDIDELYYSLISNLELPFAMTNDIKTNCNLAENSTDPTYFIVNPINSIWKLNRIKMADMATPESEFICTNDKSIGYYYIAILYILFKIIINPSITGKSIVDSIIINKNEFSRFLLTNMSLYLISLKITPEEDPEMEYYNLILGETSDKYIKININLFIQSLTENNGIEINISEMINMGINNNLKEYKSIIFRLNNILKKISFKPNFAVTLSSKNPDTTTRKTRTNSESSESSNESSVHSQNILQNSPQSSISTTTSLKNSSSSLPPPQLNIKDAKKLQILAKEKAEEKAEEKAQLEAQLEEKAQLEAQLEEKARFPTEEKNQSQRPEIAKEIDEEKAQLEAQAKSSPKLKEGVKQIEEQIERREIERRELERRAEIERREIERRELERRAEIERRELERRELEQREVSIRERIDSLFYDLHNNIHKYFDKILSQISYINNPSKLEDVLSVLSNSYNDKKEVYEKLLKMNLNILQSDNDLFTFIDSLGINGDGYYNLILDIVVNFNNSAVDTIIERIQNLELGQSQLQSRSRIRSLGLSSGAKEEKEDASFDDLIKSDESNDNATSFREYYNNKYQQKAESEPKSNMSRMTAEPKSSMVLFTKEINKEIVKKNRHSKKPLRVGNSYK